MPKKIIIKTHGASELIYTERQFIDFLLYHSKKADSSLFLSKVELKENGEYSDKPKLIRKFTVEEVEE